MKKTVTILLVILSAAWFCTTAQVGVEDGKKDWDDPFTATFFSQFSIMGQPLASQEQCVSYLRRHNLFPLLTVSPELLVEYYYEEASREGIRPDVAFAQALHETGDFNYGGDVVPFQNNYCGLGTTGGGVKGAWFPSAQLGVRAHIQHLLAYATTRRPQQPVADPRYARVLQSSMGGKAITWTDLNGRWAVPGTTYGQTILSIHQRILLGL